MDGVNYSVVAYLPEPLGEFVDGLRRRLNPRLAHWRAHVSVLPPRMLSRPPEEMWDQLREQCHVLDPFEATLSDVLTFWPVNGVVYLSIAHGSDRLAELHDRLNSGGLARVEPFPYIPHVTIAQDLDEAETQAVLREASLEWGRYAGTPAFRVESLSLVRQQPDQRWVDLAPLLLGNVLKPLQR